MSNTLAYILWLIFGGLLFAVGYFIAGLAFCITIIGIPFGVQLFKIGAYMLHPYGYRIYDDISADGGYLSFILNLLWICYFGLELAIMHITVVINLLPYTGAGSGITRALKYTPGIKFVNDEILNEFVVTVECKNVEDDVEVGNENVEDNNLVNNELKGHVSTLNDNDDQGKTVGVDVEVERQTHIPYKLLSKTQKDTIQYCSIARTYKEILAHIGYKYNSKYLESLIRPLIKMGYLELTVPDKPNSKNQKYRKVVSDSHSVTPPKHGLN